MDSLQLHNEIMLPNDRCYGENYMGQGRESTMTGLKKGDQGL